MILQRLAPDGTVSASIDTDSPEGEALTSALMEYRRESLKIACDPDEKEHVREYFNARTKQAERLLKFFHGR